MRSKMVQNNRILQVPGILVVTATLFAGGTAFAQSDSINGLTNLMPCQANCEWVYNGNSGRLCERDAEFSCANVGENRPCEETEMLTCN